MSIYALPTTYRNDTESSSNSTIDLNTSTLADLISCMEIAAYSLARSGKSSAAQIMFVAVANLEKIKDEGRSLPSLL